MNQIRKFVIGMSMLAADIILLSCCLYFTVIIQKMDHVYPTQALWFLLAAVAYAGNLILQKKRTGIRIISVCNIIWMTLSAVLVCLTFTGEPASLFMKIFICGVIIVIQGHSCYLTFVPFKTEHCVLFLDALVAVIALFLCGCELRHLSGVLSMQILCFVVIGYLLTALIFLRTTPLDCGQPADSQSGSNTDRSESPVQIHSKTEISGKVSVFVALGAIVAASCILCALLSLKAGNATRNLWSLFLMLLKNLKHGLHVIGKKCTAFFARSETTSDTADILPAGTSSTTAGNQEWIPVPDIPAWIPTVIGVVVLTFVVFFVIRIILRFRKERVLPSQNTYRAAAVIRQTVSPQKTSLLRRLRNKLYLLYRMRQQRKTPVGLAILARKRGNSIGLPMKKEESWHSYIRRLSVYGDTTTLLELAEFLERCFYSRHELPLTREQYVKFTNSLNQMCKTNPM